MSGSPIESFRISPSYLGGFLYSWEVSGDFDAPAPWIFTVQLGHTPEGPWEDISPALRNVVAWHGPRGRFLYGKSDVLHFRVVIRTSRGESASAPIQPYGDLCRRDFLLAREIMRREALRARVLSGVECDVYVRSTFGPRCPYCIDPVTGDVRDSNCSHCFGTGRYPAYFGPHRMAVSFSPDAAHSKSNSNDGTHETRTFEAMAVGSPLLKHGDVLVDTARDKRYVIGVAGILSEVRRIPCLQRIGFDEAPLSDPVYRIGEEGCNG